MMTELWLLIVCTNWRRGWEFWFELTRGPRRREA